jgi:uncharacterized protein YerC
VALTAHLLSPPRVLRDLLSNPTDPSPEETAAAVPLQRDPAAVHRITQVQHRVETKQILELVAEYVTGASIKDLSDRFQIDRVTAVRHLQHQNVPTRPNGRKLSANDILEAHILRDQGQTYTQIARHFGVHPDTIRRALRQRD